MGSSGVRNYYVFHLTSLRIHMALLINFKIGPRIELITNLNTRVLYKILTQTNSSQTDEIITIYYYSPKTNKRTM